jgi:hypothetical protein
MIFICFFGVAVGADSLSYSGRLVNTNGSPVAGPVNLKVELSYTSAPSTILCFQNISNVALTNGVFHLKVDLDCGTDSLTEVLAAVPNGEAASLRVTDLSHSKTYSFQAIHAVPFSNTSDISKQLVQMGATSGQVLQWNNTDKKWEPGTITISGGTVTNVSVNAPLTISNPASTPSITLPQSNTTTNGYISSADWNTFNNKQPLITAGTNAQYYRGDKSWQTLDTSVVPENVANLYFTNARALGVPLTGFTTSSGAIVATDTILSAFEKTQGQINSIGTASNNYLLKNSSDTITGAVNVAITGALTITNSPALPTDAANKQYVDTKLNLSGGTLSGDLNLDTQLKLKGATNYVTVKAHATTGTYNFILPQTAGTSGYVLQTDGSGNLSWINPSSVAAGAGTVDSSSISNGSIVDADVNASAAIAQSKIANLTTDLSTINTSISGINTSITGINTTISSLTTTSVAEGTNKYYLDSRALAAPLTGFVAGSDTAIVASDTTLQAFDKTQGQINNRVKKTGDSMSGNLSLDLKLRLKDSATNYVELKAPATVTTTYALTFPAAQASVVGQMLTSDTSGNLSWTTPATSATPIGSAGGDLTGSYPNPTISNANLIALKSYTTNGFLVQTAANTFAGRSITGTANRITVTNGDGVAANPTINIPTALLPSPVAGDANKFLKASGADTSAWTFLASSDITGALSFTPINKAGDSMTVGPFNFTGAAVLRTIDPVGPTDVATKQYVDSYGQWTKSGSDIYRSSNVGINTATPGQPLEVSASASSIQMRLRRTTSSAAFADIGVDDTKGLSFWPDGYGTTSANPKVVITPAGNVGIGNTAPTFKLGNSSQVNVVDQTAMGLAGANSFVWEHLVGDTAGGYTSAILNSYNNAAAHGLLVKTTNTTSSNNILILNSGGTDRMAVKGNGYVGIGTNNPGANLEVAGDTWFGMSSVAVGGDINTYYPLVISPTRRSNNFEFDFEISHGVHEDFSDAGSTYIHMAGNLSGWGSTSVNYKKTVIQIPWGSGTKRNVDEVYFDPWNDKMVFYVLGGRTYHFRSRTSGVYIYGAYGTALSWDYGNGGVFNVPAPYTTTTGSLNQGNAETFWNTNIGIGVTVPTYQLQLSTDSAAKPGSSTWTIASDVRLKDVRAPFTRGLNDLLGLNTIYFNYKKDNPLDLPSDKVFVGIKAQDVKKVIPEAVSTDEKGYLHVTNDSIIWTAVNAIKELYYKVMGHDKQLAAQTRQIASKADQSALELSNAKIKKLESENAELKARLDKIEKALSKNKGQ